MVTKAAACHKLGFESTKPLMVTVEVNDVFGALQT